MDEVRRADVVVPVYRDVELTRACLEAVLAHSGDALGRLIVVDDLSPEPEMRPMLRALRDRSSSVRLLENPENLGFVRSCNRGLAVRSADAVLLNSDTRVTPGWLSELLAVRDDWARIGAVCPLSNNAGNCSVPEFGRPTPSAEVDAAALELDRLPRWTEVPTGVGFCLLLRGDLLDLVGQLDPAYGRGYHEENDWCQRIQALGFVVARANRAFVHHVGEVSFGEARAALDAVNTRLLLGRYPSYHEQNQAFEAGPEARLAATAARRSPGRRLRVCVEVLEGDPGAASLVVALQRLGGAEVTARAGSQALREALEAQGVRCVDEAEEADLVHHPAPRLSPAAVRRALRARGHLVLTMPEVASWRVPGPRAGRTRSLVWAALQGAQGLLAPSRFVEDELRLTFELPAGRVTVVPPGVAAAGTPRGDGGGASAVRPPLLVLDRAGLPIALEAWRLLRARLGDAAPGLAVAGESSPAPAGVTFLGALAPGEVPAALAGAQALLCCSPLEPSGAQALAALAAGVPVVALPLGAVPEVLGDAGLIALGLSPAALARRLEELGQPGVGAALAARGRKRASGFTWALAAERTLAVYDAVARAPAQPSLRARQALADLVGAFSAAS